MAKKKTSKSDYIRKHPNLSVADLMAKATTDGQVLNPGLIHTVRSQERSKTRKVGSKKKGARATTGKPSKKAFILEQSLTVAAKDVVALGAKIGLKFAEGYVYTIRADNRAAAKKSPPSKKSATSKAPAAKPETRPTLGKGRSGGNRRVILEALVFELGVARVKALVAEIERNIASHLRRL